MPLHKSFPLRERGLKHHNLRAPCHTFRVVPLAGTWIETSIRVIDSDGIEVVPLAGTWIETV